MKIFGLGLSKTGTTSLHTAMILLGYRSRHYVPDALEYPNALRDYDFVCDVPICNRYRTIHAIYPDAKFILTLRDVDKWLDSCRRWFKRTRVPVRHLAGRIETFGVRDYDPDVFRRVYKAHEQAIDDYFARYPAGTLLKLPLCDQDGDTNWDALCSFLGKDRPDREFPIRNINERGLYVRSK